MIVHESFARDLARLVVWYPVRWGVRLLPPKLAYKLFNRMGDLYFHLSPKKRDRLITQMKSGLKGLIPEDSPYHRWARESFQTHYINQMQIFVFPFLTPAKMEQIHQFSGLEYLEKAQSEGKGVILLHGHFGPAHLTLHALGLKGYPAMQIGLPTDEGLSWIGKNVAFRLRMKYEKKIKAEIIPATAFLRPILEGLKEGKVIMTTGDGAGKGKKVGDFVSLPFLGGKMDFAEGPVKLARKTGAVLMPAFTLQTGPASFVTLLHPPLDLTESRSADEVMSDWVNLFEKHLIKHPGFWHFWDEFDSRFKKNQP